MKMLILLNKKWNKSLSLNNVEYFNILKFKILKDDDLNDNINNVKMSKKFLDKPDDLDFLPSLKYPEKISIGINTDNLEIILNLMIIIKRPFLILKNYL